MIRLRLRVCNPDNDDGADIFYRVQSHTGSEEVSRLRPLQRLRVECLPAVFGSQQGVPARWLWPTPHLCFLLTEYGAGNSCHTQMWIVTGMRLSRKACLEHFFLLDVQKKAELAKTYISSSFCQINIQQSYIVIGHHSATHSTGCGTSILWTRASTRSSMYSSPMLAYRFCT